MVTAPLSESETEGATTSDSDRLDEVHERAMTRFDAVAVPQRELRMSMLAARRFTTVPGAMWEDGIYDNDGLTPRPEIDKITKPMEKMEEDYRENGLEVTFLPAEGADQDTADTMNDIFRADAHVTKAPYAWRNAFSEAVKGGMGAWRLTTDYADPYDPENDNQRILPGVVIPDADQCVYFFGGVLPDGSDAKATFVISNEMRLEFNDKWGEENADPWPVNDWPWNWEWYQPDVVQVAEYYEIEDTDDRVLIFTQEASGEEQRFFKSEIEQGVASDLKAQGWSMKTRSWKRRRVRKYVMNGSRVLKDCGYIAGDNIPIVPVYYRVDWVDKMMRMRGYTQKKIDPQRILNSGVARVQEVDSLAPFEVPIVLDEQLTPEIAQEWADGNLKRFPFRRLLALRGPNGEIVQTGPVGKIDPPSVPQTTAALLQFGVQMLSDDDQDTDQPANTSAEAIELVQNRVDSKSVIPLDNMALSLARCGEIWRGMARELYFQPGRKLETRSMDGNPGTAELNNPIRTSSGLYKIRNDLTRGSYHVEASAQESTATKRQKSFRMGMELSQAFIAAQSPQDAIAVLYDAIDNLDGLDEDTRDFFRQKALGVGVKKPTPEEEEQIKQAESAKQPDPSQLALSAQAQKLGAEAQQAAAGAQQKAADARLKNAQAETLEKAPAVPQGLSAAPETPNPVDIAGAVVDAHAKAAAANLNNAKADHLREDMHHQRIRLGRDIANDHHDHTMDRRGQDLAEQQASQGDAA